MAAGTRVRVVRGCAGSQSPRSRRNERSSEKYFSTLSGSQRCPFAREGEALAKWDGPDVWVGGGCSPGRAFTFHLFILFLQASAVQVLQLLGCPVARVTGGSVEIAAGCAL